MLYCIIYIVILGIAAFPIGRRLRSRRFIPHMFPFRPFPFEKGGKIYESLRVKQWTRILPDISRLSAGYMPEKVISREHEKIDTLIQETCVAELVHWLLCFAGLLCIPLWPQGGSWVYILYITFGNLPYIIIQRYNRPRLLHLLRHMKSREDTAK